MATRAVARNHWCGHSNASATEARPAASHRGAAETCHPVASSTRASGLPAASNSSPSRTAAASPVHNDREFGLRDKSSTPARSMSGMPAASNCWPCSARRTRSLPDRLSQAGGEQHSVSRGRSNDCALSMRHIRSISALAERRSTRRSENQTGVHVEQIRTDRGVRSPRGEGHSVAVRFARRRAGTARSGPSTRSSSASGAIQAMHLSSSESLRRWLGAMMVVVAPGAARHRLSRAVAARLLWFGTDYARRSDAKCRERRRADTSYRRHDLQTRRLVSRRGTP